MLDQRDLNAPAVAVFFGENGPLPEETERRRFPSTAAAVRFVVEELGVRQQVNASLVFDDGDYCDVGGIISLYRRLPGDTRNQSAA